MSTPFTEISGDEPYDNPRKYLVIQSGGYHGVPEGDTIILDENHPSILRGLEQNALTLLDEPASIDDNGD